MAIAIDGSTPARVHATTTSVTSASFTAPANSLIVALCEEAYATTTASDMTASDSGSLSWTRGARKTGITNYGGTEAWWATPPTAAARTVTASAAATTRIGLQVVVFTGADASVPIGATGSGNIASGTLAASITSTSIGSWAWCVAEQNNGTLAFAASAGTTVYSTDNTNEGMGFLYKTAATTGVGQTLSVGCSTPSDGLIGWTMVEIMPFTSLFTSPRQIVQPYSRAVDRSATW